ncbi:MAG: ribbon-helix-helix protein, CopG family [Nitrospira sp. SB0677_bin_15]|nr:ribbon-helix-helix protein, CopG family [Nitrospira sp. SB0667_bin_9]MYD31640.1 ribbon-helix-helix protein, CopG family [Nitrospira sp. SB0661_bin_20]MYG39659.1 ribbon-helix-helix protein, CopG family [Nitrospira sp. SB0677_bin_15]MYH01368.1 ribbon-helix-helix protein, CopG family [Nitrospira sp. SB0675_bin_23]MYJ22020.1 ribbon-helix-helix protein, CopG family [Nitrospira sp. SB0673_bin_12]
MAVTTIKSTYSLDVESIRTLEKLAQRWNVSKSEVLRRAIRVAAIDGIPSDVAALSALDQLQVSLRLRKVNFAQWERDLKVERRATSQRLAHKTP